MTRILVITIILASCTPAAQRDAALATVAAGAVGAAACGIANGQHRHQFELGGCVIVGGALSLTGGVVLHSQLEAGDRQETTR